MNLLSWIFTVLFAMAGLGAFTTSVAAGILFFVVAAIAAPPVNHYLKDNHNISLSTGMKVVVCLVLLVMATTAQNNQQAADQAAKMAEAGRKAAEDRQQAIDESSEYFSNNKQAVLDSITAKSVSGDYSAALAEGIKYVSTKDVDLAELLASVRTKEFEKRRDEEAPTILAQLKALPASDFSGNAALYKKLMEFFPDDETYAEKFASYTAKANAKVAADKAEIAAFVARHGQPPTASAWDGSYRPVEAYLKRNANDPSSIDIESCTRVSRAADGYLVGCEYRGKNAFGALIKNSGWFIISNDQVIGVR